MRWEHVDLATGVIRVESGWDRVDRTEIEPKTKNGRRSVPIAGVLRDILLEHRLKSDGHRYVFGRNAVEPFEPSTVYKRARKAWRTAGLEPITPHHCRHTCASLMIAAGINAKALSTYMGHSSIQITFDLYGHLMPGYIDEAAGMLDAYLARANVGSIPAATSVAAA